MFEKWIIYTVIRGAIIYVYFEYSVPLKVYSKVLII